MGIFRWTGAFAFAIAMQPAFGDSLRGTLVDAKGLPIAKAHLQTTFLKPAKKYFPLEIPLQCDTGPDGAFALADLPEAPTAAAPIPLMVRLPDGSLTIASIKFDGEKITAMPQADLTVRTASEDGKPQVGVKFVLRQISWEAVDRDAHYSAIFRPGVGESAGLADTTGSWTLKGLPGLAKVDLYAAAPGYDTTDRREFLRGQGPCVDTFAMMGISVLTGRVMRDGKPVAGLTVRAYCNDHWDPKGIGWSQTHHDEAKTDADGRYRLAKAPTGKIEVHLDLGPLQSECTTHDYSELKVAKGQEIDGLNFALDKGIVVRGHVLTTETRKAVYPAGVRVSVGRDVNIHAETDETGAFQARVPAGQMYVCVESVKGDWLPSQPNLWETVDAEHNPPLDIRVPDGLVLAHIPHLTGVVQTPDGKPVEGALVEVFRESDTARTDATGHFHIDGDIKPMSQIVASTADLIISAPVTVTDQPNLTLTLDPKPAVVEGTILGEDGKPLAGVDVSLSGSANGYPNATTDASGAYRFRHVLPGSKYFMWMTKKGYGAVTQQDLQIGSGETKNIEPMKMVLADGVIEGDVRQLDGKPAAHAFVTAQTQESEGAFTDAKGHFKLTNVSRGSHWIAAGSQTSLWKTEKASTGDKLVLIYLPPPPKDAPGAVLQNRSGQDAPVLHIDDWVGPKFDLASLKGKVVVLDFWAVWCHPCVEALPKVEALYKKYADKGVVVLGIHAPGTALKDVQSFMKKQGLTYPIGMDPSDKTGMGLNHVTFGPTGIPHVMVIDAKGVVQSDSYEIDDAAAVVARLVGSK